MAKRPKPVVLTVLDGWGYRAETNGNAIALARKPTYDELLRKFPNTLIQTSGPAVGLPPGQMGNSEVGHLNIGAGRIVHMDITRIDLLVANRQLDQVPLFQQAMERGRQRQLHFIGLLSDGGVHSHINHLFALLEMAKQQRVEEVFVHCFLDGRDTPPNSGRDFVRKLQQKMRELGVGEIATLIGRYYAMDRDNRWERIELAYRAMVHGEAEIKSSDPIAALQHSYEQGVTDEFVKPIVITRGEGPTAPPVGLIRDDDAVIFCNFRADRARQMTFALEAPEFDKFQDSKRPKNLFFVGMTKYDKNWPWLKCIITPEKMEHILAQVFQELQYKNLDTVVNAIEKGEFDAIIMNYANADMVGHSGKLEATIKAVEAVDAGLARIYQALKPRGGAWILTADHGNAETMIDPLNGGPHTYHTTNPVPFICVTENDQLQLAPGGALRDIAPTLLGILGEPAPTDMTGRDLRVVAKV
jgi:2,3-bisphosphoglycerate-independent phosphoglycerate mutase